MALSSFRRLPRLAHLAVRQLSSSTELQVAGLAVTCALGVVAFAKEFALVQSKVDSASDKLTSFESHVDTQFSSVNKRMDDSNASITKRMDESNASISTQFAAVNKRIDESNASIGTQFAAVNKRMDESNAILTQVLSALLPKAAAEKQK